MSTVLKPGTRLTCAEVRQIRTDLGMTQVEFAQALGLSNVVIISQWENDHHPPGSVMSSAIRLLAKRQAKGKAKKGKDQ